MFLKTFLQIQDYMLFYLFKIGRNSNFDQRCLSLTCVLIGYLCAPISIIDYFTTKLIKLYIALKTTT